VVEAIRRRLKNGAASLEHRTPTEKLGETVSRPDQVSPRVPPARTRWPIVAAGIAILLLAVALLYHNGAKRTADSPTDSTPKGQPAMRDTKPKAGTALTSEPRPPTSEGKSEWFVIVGSFAKDDAAGSRQRRALLVSSGYEAKIVDTDKYPNLRPGLWAVVLGPYETEELAKASRDKAKRLVPDSYVRLAR
jgi:cell division protein FtsN